MRRILKMLARLYPASWRARYGAEYEDLLEDVEPRVLDVVDVGWAAVKMQAARGSLVRVVVPFAVIGAVVAVGLSALQPKKFESQTLVMTSSSDPSTINNSIEPAVKIALDAPTLTSIIEREHLYASERQRLPIGDVVQLMRKSIYFRGLRTANGRPASGFIIAFVDSDAHVAQRVDQELTSAFTAANLAARSEEPAISTRPHVTFTVRDPASLPQKPVFPKPGLFGAGGLFSGLFAGLLLAVVRSRRTAVAGGD